MALLSGAVLLWLAGCGDPVPASRPDNTVSYFAQDTRTSKAPNRKVIVFIHGIDGGSVDTWTASQASATPWPSQQKIDKDLKDFDIYSIGYPTSLIRLVPNIEEIAERVLQVDLKDVILKHYNSVYIIAHSMGGLVIKGALPKLAIAPEDRPALRKIAAVIFISTPAGGAQIADVASWISANPQLKNMSTDSANAFLLMLDNNWDRLMSARIQPQRVPRVFCAYERQPLDGVLVVPRLYSQAKCDSPALAFNYNHRDIVKPTPERMDVYAWVKERVRQMDAVHRFGSTKEDLKREVEQYDKEYFHEVAAAKADELVSLDPEDAESHKLRAVVLYHLDSYPAALAAIDRALELQPGYDKALFNKAAILMRLGRHAEAVPLLEERLRKTPGYVAAQSNLADSHLALRNYAEAKQHYTALVARKNSEQIPASAYLGLGIVEFLGQNANARSQERGAGHFSQAICQDVRLAVLFRGGKVHNPTQKFDLYERLIAEVEQSGAPSYRRFVKGLSRERACERGPA